MKYTFAVLFFVLVLTSNLCAQESEQDSTQPLNQAMQGRMVQLVNERAFDQNPTLREYALKIIVSNEKVLDELGEGAQLEIVKANIEHEYRSIAEHALTLLLQSKISRHERLELLMNATFHSPHSQIRSDAYSALSEERIEVLKTFIELIDHNLLADHRDRIQLIERWGVSASEATDALIAVYRARKKQYEKTYAEKVSKKQDLSGVTFDYLDILVALAEIGADTSSVKNIAFEAAEDSRLEYATAGLICLERMLAPDGHKSNQPADERMVRYAEAMLNNYDQDKDGQISAAEMARMRRPLEGADTNLDQVISIAEMIRYYTRKMPLTSRSQTLRQEGIRAIVDQTVRNVKEAQSSSRQRSSNRSARDH